MYRRAGTAAGFLAIPFVALLTSLIAVPSLAASVGAHGWAHIALAQSLGIAGGVVCGLGWNVSGPQRIAALPESQRPGLFELARLTQLIAFLPAALVVNALVMLLTPATSWLATCVVATGQVANGLLPSWYLIGLRRPWQLMATQSLPVLVLVFVSTRLIDAGWPVVWYGIATLLATLFSLGLNARIARASLLRSLKTDRRTVRAELQRQLIVTRGSASNAVQTLLPIPLVGLVAPSAIVLFSAGERLQRMVLTVAKSVPDAMQGWIGAVEGGQRKRRVAAAIGANAAFGAGVGAAFAWLASGFAHLLFSATIDLPRHITVLCGCYIAISCTSRSVGWLGLIAARRFAWFSRTNMIGAIVSIPTIMLFARVHGASGALIAEISTESLCLIINVLALARAWREPWRETPGSPDAAPTPLNPALSPPPHRNAGQ